MLTLDRFTTQNLIATLMDPEIKIYEEQIKKIGYRNNEKTGRGEKGFIYAGRFYPLEEHYKRASKRDYTILHQTLLDEMDTVAKKVQRYETEKKKLMRYFMQIEAFYRIKKPSETKYQFWRNILPDAILYVIPELENFPRTKEPGFEFSQNPTKNQEINEEFQQILDYYINSVVI